MTFLFWFGAVALLCANFLGIELPGVNTLQICGALVVLGVANALNKFFTADAVTKANVVKTNIRDTVFVYKETEKEVRDILKNYDKE